NERSHMRLVMKTVGRPLSSFKSTKEMVTAIRDAIIGHKLAYVAGLIHRDLSDGNVMIHDGGLFSGFLLDLDYAFDWMEALELAGLPVNRAAWTAYVQKYNDSRMKIKERTGTLFFMAAQVLGTFVAHDVRHDLESAIWLLMCMVLRHTLQVHVKTKKDSDRYALYLENFGATTAKESYKNKTFYLTKPLQWEVKDNEPLTKLVVDLRVLLVMQNRPLEWGQPIPLTYKSVLTAFNRALASPDWPANDAALPFTLPGTGNSSGSGFLGDGNSSGSGSQGTKHPRQDQGEGKDGDPADEGEQLPAKRLKFGPSPLRNEVGANPSVEASDNDDVFN
ncbi:hypothetical protein FOMPIDRAFT_1128119, partial [Fomitopsis schrenkii]